MSCLQGYETPLLESEDARHKNWWIKIIDLTEAKHQILFALPMIFINVSYYFIPLVSVMFAGHLGDHELAGSNLANSWATVTGFSLVIGLSGALETLCGQGFGARMYRMMGINLQASCIITTIFSTLVSILWWYSDKILILLHQDPQISNSAGLYLKYLIPGLFAYGILQNILRFLQTQSVIVPLAVCSSIPLVLHIGIAYVLVYQTPSLGFKGAGLATSVSLWISLLMLGLYVVRSKRFHQTWQGFSSESFMYVSQNLKLALPSAAMVCLEYCAFEILVLLAGLMPDSEISTSLIAMCVNTEAICYMIAYGLSAAASTRVSNELGSGDHSRAKQATTVSLKLTVLLALFTVTLLSFGHNLWAKSFSDSPVIVEAYASVTPLLVLSIFCDFVQGILSGVARGCGWQHMVVLINLGTFYLVGMTVAVLLGFYFSLYAKGLWIGLICGLFLQMTSLLMLTKFSKWTRIIDQISQDNVVA